MPCPERFHFEAAFDSVEAGRRLCSQETSEHQFGSSTKRHRLVLGSRKGTPYMYWGELKCLGAYGHNKIISGKQSLLRATWDGSVATRACCCTGLESESDPWTRLKRSDSSKLSSDLHTQTQPSLSPPLPVPHSRLSLLSLILCLIQRKQWTLSTGTITTLFSDNRQRLPTVPGFNLLVPLLAWSTLICLSCHQIGHLA